MGIFRLKFYKIIVIEIFGTVKFHQKQETLNLGSKELYLGTLRPKYEKPFKILEIITLEFVKIEFSTNTVKFSIVSTISKGPRSAFS